MASLPLPQNIEVERALLGAILEDNDALFDANHVLVAEDFFEPWNGNAYNLMRDKIEPGGRVSAATLLHDLSQNAIVDSDLTAKDVIAILAREAAPRSQVATLAETIRELSRRRTAIAILDQAAADLRAAPASVTASEIRDKLDGEITALYDGVQDFGLYRLHEVGEKVIDEANKLMNRDDDPGIRPGLSSVEDLTGSFLPRKLYAIAGGSGSGKSALAQQIGEHIAMDGKRKVLFVQLEMDREEVARRYLTRHTGIGGKAIARGNINPQELNALFEANLAAKHSGLIIDTPTSLNIFQLRQKAIRMKRLIGLDVLIVDHLQYVEKPDRRMSEVEAIGPNLRGLKQIAKELDVALLILVQLKASFSEGPVRNPRVSDIWNASAVEQNVDAILFVNRREYMLRRNEPDKGSEERPDWEADVLEWANKAELRLGKLREDKGYGSRVLTFHAARMQYIDNVQEALRRDIGEELPF